MRLPLKVKNIVWRICSDFIPTKHALYYYRVNVDLYCPVCSSEVESDSHIFMFCSMALHYWRLLNVTVPFDLEVLVFDWFSSIIQSNDLDKSLMVCMVLGIMAQ